MNADEFQLPPDVVEKINDKCGRIDKVVKGIYYQFTKHKLTNYDCCVALSAVFNGIKSAQDEDGKTEMEMMFTSLIEQRPEMVAKSDEGKEEGDKVISAFEKTMQENPLN